MLNYILIIILFTLLVLLYTQLINVKSRLRFMESLLANQLNDKVVTPPFQSEVTAAEPHSLNALNSTAVSKHSIFKVILSSIYGFLTEGNSFVRIGMLVLFIGIAFLLKYAAQIGYFPVTMRLFCTALFAIGLFIIGFLLEKKRLLYAINLEGGAIAILYLLVFTAFYRYHLFTANLSFGLLVLITLFTFLWSVTRNTKTLALVGVLGGFIAPILINYNQPNTNLLFGYYLILNLGIVITAWFRNWRALNCLGLLFTFLFTALWYWKSYSINDFYIAEFFLFIFFTLYLFLAILTAFKQPPQLKGFIESSLVFALPVLVFALQAHLFNFSAFPLAITAISLGFLYAVLSMSLYYFADTALMILSSAFAAIAVIFFTAAIPLLLSGEWTSAIWALESAALIWVGIKQYRPVMKFFGILIALLANSYFFINFFDTNYFAWFSNTVINNIILTVTNLSSAYFLFNSSITATWFEKFIQKLLLF